MYGKGNIHCLQSLHHGMEIHKPSTNVLKSVKLKLFKHLLESE
jgi:hypothetical protein